MSLGDPAPEFLGLIPEPSRSLPRILRGSGAYVAAALAYRLPAFVLLPIYLTAIEPDEFGRLAVVLTTAAGLGAVMSIGLETPIIRAIVRSRREDANRDLVISSLGTFTFLLEAVLLVGVLLVYSTPISRLIGVTSDTISFAGLAVGSQVLATIFPLAVLRALERHREYLVVSVTGAVANVGAMLVLVVWLRMGAVGWVAASAIGSAILLGAGVLVVRPHWSRRFSPAVVLSAVALGLPLLPHVIAHWGLSQSDRLVLNALVPADQIGIYNLAAQFGLPIGILLVAINQATMPLFAEARGRDTRDLTRIVNVQVMTSLGLGATVAMLGPAVVFLAMPSAYWPAANLIPMIAVAYTLFGLYLVPTNILTMTLGRTRWLWLATACAAISNVGLNLALVPAFGIAAAAANTLLAYAVLFVLVLSMAALTPEARIPANWPSFLVAVLVASVAVVGASTMLPANTASAIVLRGVLLAGVIALLTLLCLNKALWKDRA